MNTSRKTVQELRAEWMEAKKLSMTDETAKALYMTAKQQGCSISYNGFYYMLWQMKKLGLEGTPYIDTKTFDGWKKAGFQVRRGEHSKLNGLIWMHPTTVVQNGDGTSHVEIDETVAYPKMYYCFHSSQVEAK